MIIHTPLGVGGVLATSSLTTGHTEGDLERLQVGI